jgi:hypothetical protein
MTPKEKARELTDKIYLKIPSVYDPTNLPHYPIAKEMALIAVDEILKNYYKKHYIVGKNIDYWNEVKKEIEKI